MARASLPPKFTGNSSVVKNSRSVLEINALARADWSRMPLRVSRYRVDSTSPLTSKTSSVGLVPNAAD